MVLAGVGIDVTPAYWSDQYRLYLPAYYCRCHITMPNASSELLLPQSQRLHCMVLAGIGIEAAPAYWSDQYRLYLSVNVVPGIYPARE
jgi:hypothetical protein